MKKCPSCQKTFENDDLKFCQSDGTPLVSVAEEAEVDPYKTVVGNQSDISELIAEQDKKEESAVSEEPKVEEEQPDPFKPVVASEQQPTPTIEPKTVDESDDGDDFLEIPEEQADDPMKTMVVTGDTADNIKVNIPEEKVEETPVPTPPVNETPLETASEDIQTPSPELPKFSEPDVQPPDLGGQTVDAEEPELPKPSVESVSEPVQETSQPEVSPPISSEESSEESGGSKDVGSTSSSSIPIPSPFDQSMPPGYAPPSTPPFEPPKEDVTPEPLNEQVEAQKESFDPAPASPFAEPEAKQEPVVESTEDWSPPPAPMQEFEGKEIGQNTPFDTPPTSGEEGENKTLAIVSMICGVLSMLCCASIITGPIGLITGYMARGKIAENPAEFGGGTFALIGMITGAIGTVLFVIVLILQLVFGLAGNF